MISSIPTAADTSMRPCLRLQLLAELLQGFNVSVVTYVRDALPLLLSTHYQTQRGGSVPGRTARWQQARGATGGCAWNRTTSKGTDWIAGSLD